MIGRAEPGFGNDRENFASDDSWLRTNAGGSTAETITGRDRDLATGLIGQVSFMELPFPSAGSARRSLPPMDHKLSCV